ncbi:MAG TPA: AAA family ATPase [Smithella sp.]|nr:AAA family ATPase [Smithella sp.]
MFKKRRRHVHHTQPVHGNLDKNERFIKRQCCIYLERLLAVFPLTDRDTVEMLTYVLGPKISELKKTISKKVYSKQRHTPVFDTDDELDILDDDSDDFYQMIKHAGKKIQKEFITLSRTVLAKRVKTLSYAGKSEMEKKLDTLDKMFALSNEEKAFTTLLYINTVWPRADEYFVDHLHCQDIFGRRYLKVMLQITDSGINRILSGTLARIEFFEFSNHSFNLSDDYLGFFQKPLKDVLKKKDFVRFSGKTIPLKNHLIDPGVTKHILSLLRTKRESSNHILLYGPPGTGKTSYALGLVNKLKIPAYAIMDDSCNQTRTRRAAIIACRNMTNDGEGSLIIVDEADSLLNTEESWSSGGEIKDKGWLNQLLEEPGARMIWITNSIEDMEDSVLRRFAFSVHFPAFNRRQRFSLWESVLCRHHVRKLFKDDEINKLTARYPVSAAIINMAVTKALESAAADHIAFKEIMIMNLDAHWKLLNGGAKPKTGDRIEEHYSIEGLNIEGNLPVILAQLDSFDRCLRAPDKSGVRNFNLLFYGPPGAGKSELARYVAKRLDRELMVKRASDIVSPYVGETEQNISRVFSEAESMEAVLVIDEADSFLFRRDRAVRSWEISHTNEFLTQMERFRGILICTTNRFADLDMASVRRFNQKIGFGCLKPAENMIFYQKLLCGLCKTPVNRNQEELIGRIHDLTPGDFRIVRDRFAISDEKCVTHEQMIQALEAEARVKKTQQGNRPIGFMRRTA